MAKEDFPNWSDLKKILQHTDKNKLIDIIQDFYEHPAENFQTIVSRHIKVPYTKGKKSDWILESFQRIIMNEFYPDEGPGGLRLDVIRKAVMEYSEGSGDLAGTMELMLFFVENVVDFVNEYGGVDEEFIDEGCEMLSNFSELLKTPEGQGFYPNFKARLLKLRRESEDMGYGFGDDIDDYVEEIEDFFKTD